MLSQATLNPPKLNFKLLKWCTNFYEYSLVSTGANIYIFNVLVPCHLKLIRFSQLWISFISDFIPEKKFCMIDCR